jgi:imidazolonepropionase-like amidohydrolase
MYTAWHYPKNPALEKQMPITLIRTAALAVFLLSGTCLGHDAPAAAATTTTVPASPVTLFQNVRIYDGKADLLSPPTNVLVEGNRIARISSAAIAADPSATVIAGNERTLMPGLIDMHWHTMMVRPTPVAAISGDIGYNNLLAGAEATDTLMRGFTTVRDLGGPAFGLKQAIDDGIVVGPRIYPSGAMITVTSGHGDFRQPFEVPRVIGGPLTRMEAINGSMVADTPDEVRIRVREQLMQDASQMTAGGSVSSLHSPLDVSTFTEPELRAAVEAAENWGTYVTVHAYTPAAIQRAIAAGVRNIEHAHLMDEASAMRMAEKGICLNIQPFLDDADAIPIPPRSTNRARQLEVIQGTDIAYALRGNTR